MAEPDINIQSSGRKKRAVALYSIAASMVMIIGKALAAIITGSLAILTDTLHSLLDLSASIITYFAVKISDRPADREHHFGHVKVESLAALVQVTILLLTCGAIGYEAIGRLFKPGRGSLEISVWAFSIIIGSIIIDFTRVRALRRAAKKYKSQALAADALNFATDIWSSVLVLFSLAAVRFGFAWADPVAAIGVAIFILTAVLRMGREAIDILLDRAPVELEQALRSFAEKFSEVQGVRRFRSRSDGRQVFAEMILEVDRSLSFASAGELKEHITGRFREEFPDVDVTLTFKPTSPDSEEKATAIRYVISSFGLSLHHLIVKKFAGGYFASMHIEMPGDLSLKEAHEKVSEITEKLHKDIDDLDRVVIHTEPLEEKEADRPDSSCLDLNDISNRVKEIVESFPGVSDCHNIVLTPHSGGLALSADMRLDGSLPLEDTHDKSEEVERELKSKIRELVSVTLHLEPTK